MTDGTILSPAVPKPDHVPNSAVYDFDMFKDPAYLANPHTRILDMIENAPPVFWTPRNGGHWMLISHAANFKASRDTESFSSVFISPEQAQAMKAALPPGSPHIPQPLPITADPPDHAPYRAPLHSAFSPKSILAMKDKIRDLAVDLIEAAKPNGRCEFMGEIAEPLPVQIFLEMFGLPVERQVEYRALVKDHMASMNDSDPGRTVQRMQRVAEIMRSTFQERRDHPRDDLISLLWQSDIGGKPTTMDDLENYGVVLFTAGLDTVMNGMGLGVRHLAMHPELQAELRANPKLIIEAAEEILRRYTFTVPPRRVGKDLEFDGIPMKKGERVMLFLPAADLDPGEFPEQDRFDLQRENKAHIAFGTGPHRCLGSHLARVELQVLYEELLARLPEFRLDPERPTAFHGGHVVGPETLWILWDA